MRPVAQSFLTEHFPIDGIKRAKGAFTSKRFESLRLCKLQIGHILMSSTLQAKLRSTCLEMIECTNQDVTLRLSSPVPSMVECDEPHPNISSQAGMHAWLCCHHQNITAISILNTTILPLVMRGSQIVNCPVCEVKFRVSERVHFLLLWSYFVGTSRHNGRINCYENDETSHFDGDYHCYNSYWHM